MQEELRRSNTIGDSKGILHFAGTVLKNGEIKRDSARHICSFINDARINFNSAVSFFEYLGFLSVSHTVLTPTENGKSLYALIGDGFDEALCEACLDKVTKDDIVDVSALKFDPAKGKYNIQKHGFPIAAAVFRNVLIQLCALIERPDGTLELAEQYEPLFVKAHKANKDTKRKISLEDLKRQQERQEEQGEAAELFVLAYEQARLSGNPNVNRVKRISEIDVSAGYDIVSFDGESSDDYDRFVEVKSYIGKPHFYWTKNEINIASLLGVKYCIYLVDMEKAGQPNYTPTIIRDPAMVVLGSDDWLMQPTSYLVLPTGG